LNNWDVSNVTFMDLMFNQASSFNQPLNNWNVSNVMRMMDMFFHATSFNQPLNNWNVLNAANTRVASYVAGATGLTGMFDGATAMEEKNKASVENYNKYLETIQAREGAVVFADEVAASRHKNKRGSKPLPEEISREILEYLPMGNIKNADIATSSGYRQSLKREALRPLPSASGETAADALGGRTRRRRRHGKRKTRKSRKGRKRRHTKKR